MLDQMNPPKTIQSSVARPLKVPKHLDRPEPFVVMHGSHVQDCPPGCQCPCKQLANPRQPKESNAQWMARIASPDAVPGKDHSYRRGETVMSEIDLVDLHGDKFARPNARPEVVVLDPFAPLPGESDADYKVRIEGIRRKAMELLGIKGVEADPRPPAPPPAPPPAAPPAVTQHQANGGKGKQS